MIPEDEAGFRSSGIVQRSLIKNKHALTANCLSLLKKDATVVCDLFVSKTLHVKHHDNLVNMELDDKFNTFPAIKKTKPKMIERLHSQN
jgi:hypothetical protein